MTNLIDRMCLTDSMTWSHHNKINLRDGYKFSLKDIGYVIDIIDCEKKTVNVKKGAQMCLTTSFFLDDIHACKYRRYKQNIIYMMPTVTAVERLSKVSFDPIFQFNPWIMRKGDTNTTMCREINGRSIVMVGAQPKKVGGSGTKDSDNIRSIPCDRIDCDEVDLMDQDMWYQAGQRLLRSEIGKRNNFGSPTYPGYGIDKLYEESDQRKWQIVCGSCGKETCLGETFPDCIIQKDGRWFRSCIHCHAEIFVNNGSYRAEYPDRREAGFWLSGLLSPYADLDEFMYQYNNIEGSKMCEFMRSRLGIATTESENQLDDTTVLSRCTQDGRMSVSVGETAMGVDINKTINAVIGIRTAQDTYDVLGTYRLNDLNELHDLAMRMNVQSCVIDSGPYDHGVRDFQKSEPYTIYLCQYSETQPGKPKWDRIEGIVRVNRNEWCDTVHDAFTNNKIRIPRRSAEIKEYAKQLTSTAKIIIEHPETGQRRPRWIKIGRDDFFHGTLYFLLAAGRTTPRARHQNVIKRPTHIVSQWS